MVGVVAQPGPDSGEHLVRLFGGLEAVQADHEDMAEAALVRGVRGPQREMGGVRRGVMQSGGDLGGERLGEIRRGQVVARLVGGGQQCVEVRVGAVGGQPRGPAAAAGALQQSGLGFGGRRGVEAVEAGWATGLCAGPEVWTGTAVRVAGCLSRFGRPAWDSLDLDSVGLLESAASVNLESEVERGG